MTVVDQPHRRARSRLARALLLVAAVVAGAGCQLRTDVNLTVEPDGSGVVEVAVALDADGVDEHPELLDSLEFDDLVDAGWEVSGPALDDDGFTRVSVRHDFGEPAEVASLLDQVAGADGPFRDFSVVRDDAFAETTYRFDGVVDFSSGVEGLTEDPELTEALDASPVELIEERLGGAVDEILQFQVAVRLPGDVASNAPTQASNGAVWRPSVLEQETIELSATSTIRRSGRLAWLAVAVASGIGLVLFLVVRFALWRRSRDTVPGS